MIITAEQIAEIIRTRLSVENIAAAEIERVVSAVLADLSALRVALGATLSRAA